MTQTTSDSRTRSDALCTSALDLPQPAGALAQPGPATGAVLRPAPGDTESLPARTNTLSIGSFLLSAQFPGQSHSQALERTVNAAVATEQSGLDNVWLAEHHFVPYGVCPSATTLAALLLGRTRRIGVGTAVSVLSTNHPVTLGEQAALLHLTSGGRFTLGVGRGGPWIDLDVFGTGVEAFEHGFTERLDLLLRWLRDSRVGASGPQFSFPEVAVVPRATEQPLADRDGLLDWLGNDPAGPTRRFPRQRRDRPRSNCAAANREGRAAAPGGPPMLVACTSPASVKLAAQRGLPMLLGMHSGDEDKQQMLAAYRAAALACGRSKEQLAVVEREHVAAGLAQVADRTAQARSTLLAAMPGWFQHGLGAHRTVDGRERRMRDPYEYTELLCDLHAVGTPQMCADRLLGTAERTGIRRFALLVEGSGGQEETLRNIERLGSEVLPLLV